jgi:hypothetical protein
MPAKTAGVVFLKCAPPSLSLARPGHLFLHSRQKAATIFMVLGLGSSTGWWRFSSSLSIRQRDAPPVEIWVIVFALIGRGHQRGRPLTI